MRISYPPELPVSARREDIAAAIRDHQVVIVAGETGSGKTTQLPKICLELGRGQGRTMIGHTQPRRIAARSVAERIADELETSLGEAVGYQVRFTDQTSRATRVKVMTDGILLAELQRDRLLRRYDTIIIDEAHERSLNIDFLLGYLKRLLPKRPDLKVIITSATIDPERFARHFADRRGKPAPIIEVSGRTFPVQVRYRPLVELPETDDDGEPVVRDQTEAVVDAVRELCVAGPGDVLVFLPGEREIRDTADALADAVKSAPQGDPLRRAGHVSVEIVPLYSRLTAAEQHRVFSSHDASVRRVVLSTNVAETSLTVPGIKYVVDTGVARISRYSVRTKVQRLPIEPISQASANQRSGRCGRTSDGIAIRLYSEDEFAARPAFTDPEILRTNLASVILQMVSLGLGDLARFPFIDPPDPRNITAGKQLLEELGALQAARPVPAPPPTGEPRDTPARGRGRGRRGPAPSHQGPTLTPIGRRLARLPIDPRLGRMILEAEKQGCGRDVIVIAAALSLQDPREHPEEQRPQADQAHARFVDKTSDFLTWLALWNYLRTQQKELSSSAFRRMCRREFLNYLRVREWQDFESQLRQVCKEVGIELGRARRAEEQPDADGIHQALLSGLLSHVGVLEEREQTRGGGRSERRPMREYLGARGAKFAIFPGSALKGNPPGFVMAAELVETSRLWARQNAAIDPAWAERLGAHLIKRTYSEPHWSASRGSAVAHERVTLYGVPLAADRLVNYGKIDPAYARELFIRHALVYGEWQPRPGPLHEFWRRNAELLAEAEELEHRARRRDIVVDEHTLFEFYDARVGAEAISLNHFDTWWGRLRKQHPKLLTFDPEMLTHGDEEELAEKFSAADFPLSWSAGGAEGPLTFSVGYHFEPGAPDDGVTVDVPVLTLNQVDAEEFSWNVPGLRHELVTSLIRSLPKQLRVHFVPAPNTAREFLATVAPGEESLTDSLSRYLRGKTGIHVPVDAWDYDKLPDHLRPTFRILDADGTETARGKDLEALKAPLAGQFAEAMAQAATDSGFEATGQTSWTFGVLPESFTTVRAGHQVQGYPALLDEGIGAGRQTVGLGVFGSAVEAEACHRAGVRRLVALALPEAQAVAQKSIDALTGAEKLALAVTPYPTTSHLAADLVLAVLDDTIAAANPGTVRDQESFAALFEQARAGLPERIAAALADLLTVLAAWREVDRLLSGRAELALLPSLADMQAHLGRLIHRGFLGEFGARGLADVRRYLAGLRLRRERLDASGVADRTAMQRVAPFQDAYDSRVAVLPDGTPPSPGLQRLGRLIEEFRVSLWGQPHLRTAEPVSEQRLRKALDAADSGSGRL